MHRKAKEKMMHLPPCTLLVNGFLGIAVASACVCRAADEASGKPGSKAPSSLDQQLLDDLDNALLEGLDDLPTENPKSGPAGTTARDQADSKESPAVKRPSRPTGKSPLDDELLRELGGEDIGDGAVSKDPLVGIGRQMRSVESRLTDRKLDEQTRRLQQKIVAELSALLEECKKQCQGGGSGKPGSKPGKGSQAGKSPGQAPSDTARDSSEKMRDRQTQRGDAGALVNAMRESWGNLPEHLRENLANVKTDAFLPKYELMLEKYFKRLGEDDTSER